MNASNPGVSVVIPAYSAEKTIARTLNSVVKCSLDNLEIIVVEDGQLDDTANVVRNQFGEAKLISYEKNQGGCHARNIGLAKVKYDYVMFLDSDDYILQDFLEGLYAQITVANADICFGRCTKLWENGKSFVAYEPRPETNEDVILRWLLGESGPGTCSVLWKTSSLKAIGGWDEKLKRNQDGELVLRAMFNDLKLARSNISTSVYWQHSTSRVSTSGDYVALESLIMVRDKVSTWIENYSGSYKKEFSNALRVFETEIKLKLLSAQAPNSQIERLNAKKWFPRYSLYKHISNNNKTFIRHIALYFLGLNLFLFLQQRKSFFQDLIGKLALKYKRVKN